VGAGGGKMSTPPLDLQVVQEKLSGQVVHLFPADAMSSTAVKISWEVKRNQRFIEGFHVLYRAVSLSSPPLAAGGGADEGADDRAAKQSSSGGTAAAISSRGLGEFTVETVQGNTVTLYTLANLERNTMYEIRVQPFYMTVTGQESNPVHVKTFEDGMSFYLT